MQVPDEENIMKQEPRKVEVGYFKKRQQRFNSELEKGLNGQFKTSKPASPANKKTTKKQEKPNAENKGSQSDEQ